MSNNTNSGFTIIETMLFLAVSGTLFALIMVGVGSNIEQQRYRDSVNSLKSYIQEQYAQAVNINNNRTGSEQCRLSGSSLEVVESPESRGTSECIMLGRYVIGSDDGKKLTSGVVLGHPRPTMTTGLSDHADVAENYATLLSGAGTMSYDIAWGNRIVGTSNSSSPQSFQLLFIRSPQSGRLMTLTDITTATSGLSELNLCIDGNVSGSTRVGVHVPRAATSQSAIQVMTEDGSVCD